MLAFGAKIVRQDGSSQVNEVILTEPIEGSHAEVVEPSQLGGTRHLSCPFEVFFLNACDGNQIVA